MRILRAGGAAIAPEPVLLLGEQILEPNPARVRSAGYLIDTQMMAMFGRVRERTVDEFRDILAESRFAVRRIVPTVSPVSIIEAASV